MSDKPKPANNEWLVLHGALRTTWQTVAAVADALAPLLQSERLVQTDPERLKAFVSNVDQMRPLLLNINHDLGKVCLLLRNAAAHSARKPMDPVTSALIDQAVKDKGPLTPN